MRTGNSVVPSLLESYRKDVIRDSLNPHCLRRYDNFKRYRRLFNIHRGLDATLHGQRRACDQLTLIDLRVNSPLRPINLIHLVG